MWADAVATDGSDPAGVTSRPGNPWAAHTAKIVVVKRPDLLPDRRIDYVMVRGYN